MRFLVALSGGVDSAVAAARLCEAGHDLVGVHLRTGVETAGEAAGGARSCCGADDARDARQVAATLGIPFYVVDVAAAFSGVIDDFVASYASGRTPNPCVLCNKSVKFGRLREIATALGADRIATGHYARVERSPSGRFRLLRAADPSKDQTYVLYALDQAQLESACFPLGTTTKDEVRREAAALGLGVADKPDSQDLCFVPGGDYRRFLAEQAPDVLVPGEVVDEASGDVVGAHDGAAGFTIGQRRGLPAVGERRYVVDVDAQAGRITVAPRDRLLRTNVIATGVNWIDELAPAVGRTRRVEARIRHAAEAVPATLTVRRAHEIELVFDEPVFAPAPGQAVVAYAGEAVLCGGTVASASGGGRNESAFAGESGANL